MARVQPRTPKGFDYGTILSRALASIIESVAETRGQAHILSPLGNQLFIVASTVPDEIGQAVLIDDSVSGLAFKSQSPIIIADVQNSPHYKKFFGSGMRSEIVVPLPEEWGVIKVESPKLNAFKEGHIAILKKLGEQIYENLPNAILSLEFDILLEIEQEIEHKIAGTASQDIYANICALICEKAQRLIGAEHMQILMVEEDGEHLGIIFSSYPTEVTRIRIGNSVPGQAMLQRRSRNVPDVRKETDFRATIPGTKSELVAVARDRQKVMVLVNAESPRLNAFTRHHETLLALFAQQAARAWRYMQFGVAMGRMQAEKRAAQTLVAAADLMGNMVHSYNGKFDAIDYWRRFVVNRTATDDKAVLDALAEMEKALSDIKGLPDQIRERLGQAEQIVILDLNELVRETLTWMIERGKIPADTRVEIDLPEAVYVSASTYGLTRVVENLIGNASEAAGPSGTLTVSTRIRAEGVRPIGPCAELTVRDTGRGMNEETRQRIFEPGFSTKPPGSGRMGFGLFWVKLFVDRFRGEVRIHSESGRGTTVSVLLPVPGGAELAEQGSDVSRVK